MPRCCDIARDYMVYTSHSNTVGGDTASVSTLQSSVSTLRSYKFVLREGRHVKLTYNGDVVVDTYTPIRQTVSVARSNIPAVSTPSKQQRPVKSHKSAKTPATVKPEAAHDSTSQTLQAEDAVAINTSKPISSIKADLSVLLQPSDVLMRVSTYLTAACKSEFLNDAAVVQSLDQLEHDDTTDADMQLTSISDLLSQLYRLQHSRDQAAQPSDAERSIYAQCEHALTDMMKSVPPAYTMPRQIPSSKHLLLNYS